VLALTGHGPSRAGPERRAAAGVRRTGTPRAPSRPWAASGRGLKTVFSVIFYRLQFLLFFVQILSKFQIVFSIQIIPTKILFREFRSDRNFSVKYKVNEFFNSFCFRYK
jgi:hypothetical protein